jgi:hypothetical protein
MCTNIEIPKNCTNPSNDGILLRANVIVEYYLHGLIYVSKEGPLTKHAR